MNTKEKSITIIEKIVYTANFIFVLLMLAILVSGICINKNTANSFLQFLGAILLCSALLVCYRFIPIEKITKTNTCIFSILFGLFIIQVLAICSSYTSFGWDVKMLVGAAQALYSEDKGFLFGYYDQYPNNLLLVFIYNKILSVLGNSNPWIVLPIFNALSADLSLFFIYKIVLKLSNFKKAFYSLLLGVLVLGIFPWILVPYSDVLSLPFTTGTLLLALKLKDTNSNMSRLLLSLLLGIILFFSYNIKPTNIIILIAIFIITLFYLLVKNKKQIITLLCISIVSLCCLFTLNKLWNHYVYNVQEYLILNKEAAFPLQHFALLGLSEVKNSNGEDLYGTYNANDVEYTKSFPTLSERKAGDMQAINNRLKERGLIGTLRFEFKKIAWFMNDGTFYWGEEGEFADFTNLDGSVFKSLWYTTSNHFTIYYNWANLLWKSILLLICIPTNILWINKKHIDWNISLFRCTITGIFLFLCIFECRSRYLILYLPYFTILAAYGLDALSSFTKQKKIGF